MALETCQQEHDKMDESKIDIEHRCKQNCSQRDNLSTGWVKSVSTFVMQGGGWMAGVSKRSDTGWQILLTKLMFWMRKACTNCGQRLAQWCCHVWPSNSNQGSNSSKHILPATKGNTGTQTNLQHFEVFLLMGTIVATTPSTGCPTTDMGWTKDLPATSMEHPLGAEGD